MLLLLGWPLRETFKACPTSPANWITHNTQRLTYSSRCEMKESQFLWTPPPGPPSTKMTVLPTAATSQPKCTSSSSTKKWPISSRGFWVVLPYSIAKDLPDSAYSPPGTKEECNRRARLVVDHSWFLINELTKAYLYPEVMQFGGTLPRLLCRVSVPFRPTLWHSIHYQVGPCRWILPPPTKAIRRRQAISCVALLPR